MFSRAALHENVARKTERWPRAIHFSQRRVKKRGCFASIVRAEWDGFIGSIGTAIETAWRTESGLWHLQRSGKTRESFLQIRLSIRSY